MKPQNKHGSLENFRVLKPPWQKTMDYGFELLGFIRALLKMSINWKNLTVQQLGMS